eukprot:jgi/Chlat1/234/Chrsp1S03135
MGEGGGGGGDVLRSVNGEAAAQQHLAAKQLAEVYEVRQTARFIVANNFSRVALQFPDELLKDATAVTAALKAECSQLRESQGVDAAPPAPKLFVLADTTFGSCCVDEVAASHLSADCVVHYGHTCLSPCSRLPVRFVFGRAPLNTGNCSDHLLQFAKTHAQVLVLYALEYAYKIEELMLSIVGRWELGDLPLIADVSNAEMFPSASTGANTSTASSLRADDAEHRTAGSATTPMSELAEGLERVSLPSAPPREPDSNDGLEQSCQQHALGGLTWSLPAGHMMEDYNIFAMYDPSSRQLRSHEAQQSKALMRRYYLVEKAKDANIVGIVVGTLGVAGYLQAVQRLRSLIEQAGKKSYLLVTGRPTPVKLANLPECEVWVLVACTQTALLDSKDFMAPIITPFEAELAFTPGLMWTGAYRLDFASLAVGQTAPRAQPTTSLAERGNDDDDNDEPHFSLVSGGYRSSTTTGLQDVSSTALVQRADTQLSTREHPSALAVSSTGKDVEVRSGAEYLLHRRSYTGLQYAKPVDENGDEASYAAVQGRTGRAAAYADETR